MITELMEEEGAKEMAKSILELELVCLIFNRNLAGYYLAGYYLFDTDIGTIVRNTNWLIC